MKRILSVILVVLMLTLGMGSSFGNSDIPSNWAKSEVEFMIQHGFIPENLQYNYKTAITREEFTQLLVALLEIYAEITLDYEAPSQFVDTNSPSVNKAFYFRLINGVGNSRFNPDGLITREQIAVMFINTLEVFDMAMDEDLISYSYKDVDIDDFTEVSGWAKGHVKMAILNEVMSGTSSDKIVFAPKSNVTREQAILICYNVLKNAHTSDHVGRIDDSSNNKVASSLEQALFLNRGNKAVDVDLVDWFGESRKKVESKLGDNLDFYNWHEYLGNTVVSYPELSIALLYDETDLLVGATAVSLENNHAFTGSIMGLSREYSKEYILSNFQGQLLDDDGLTFFIFDTDDNLYAEIVWHSQMNEFSSIFVIKGDYSFLD